MESKELIPELRLDAEWAHANEWETPIMLGDHLDAAADALATYEDTGLTPEEIAHAKDLLAAEKDGRLVTLPCPFYSQVYAVAQFGKEIIYGELLSTNKDYCLVTNNEGTLTSKGKTWKGIQVRSQDVFLTRAEAEKALGKESQA